MGLKLNGTHQLLVYACNVYLLEDSINTVQKNTESLTAVGLEVNTEKTKYSYAAVSPECRAKS
jgi:hypothetical protein